MIKALKALFRRTPREHPAKKSAPSVGSKPSNAGGEYRAVSLAPGNACCAAVGGSPGKRYLLRHAPRLPLVDCTMPTKCSCKYCKHADLRDGDRRALGVTETGRWFAGPELRKRGGRRSTKK
jgi:hypothetical protein